MKPIVSRPSEHSSLKSIGLQKKSTEWIGCGRESGLLNIKQWSPGRWGSCGDAVSDPISISCSPARLQLRLHSDFYSTWRAAPGTVTLFRSALDTILYTNHDTMHLCLSHLQGGILAWWNINHFLARVKLLRGFANSFVILYQQFFSALTPVTPSFWDYVCRSHPEQF